MQITEEVLKALGASEDYFKRWVLDLGRVKLFFEKHPDGGWIISSHDILSRYRVTDVAECLMRMYDYGYESGDETRKAKVRGAIGL